MFWKLGSQEQDAGRFTVQWMLVSWYIAQVLAVSSHGRKGKIVLQDLFYKSMNLFHEDSVLITYQRFHLQIASDQVSTQEFQSIADSVQNFCLSDCLLISIVGLSSICFFSLTHLECSPMQTYLNPVFYAQFKFCILIKLLSIFQSSLFIFSFCEIYNIYSLRKHFMA